MNFKKTFVGLLLLGTIATVNAQIDSLKMDISLKTRAEGNNGYATLIPSGKNMDTKVLSRARLGLNYYYNRLEVRVAMQDAAVWGDRSSINKIGNIDFFEAWAKYQFSPAFYAKVGRQVLSYDNERLIGETDWAMQGRSFDALKLGYQFGNKAQLEVVATYNNDNKNIVDADGNTIYSIADGDERTKSVQLIHFQSPRDREFQYSAIAMNNLVQNLAGTTNAMTTLGLNLSQKFNDRFAVSAFGYYQLGHNTLDQQKNAYDVSLDFHYQLTTFWKATLGGELLSGTRYDEASNKNKSFSPLYGTNHKFNGYMDYFTFNGSGMNNFYLKNTFLLPKAGSIDFGIHYLEANQDFAANTDRYLGTELDLVYAYPISKSFVFNLGYSQLFASDQMKVLKNVPNARDNQSFMWIGLNFNPKFRLYSTHK
ncbi:alginate export family protein [Elizabethkingia sp. JS20170427COW]|uniref:alginate export family protein n=1 Tax=Elizabethkingia sp. JS20170427COW TaxID=2583851 RepID=UPI001110CCBB|nr:alginate export family protein [Elizabethkingia sp. JS20170427COW]QCX53133.1 hypothetical protein FGE20_05015 [Elizabethkingia sp. JS20170427COW]